MHIFHPHAKTCTTSPLYSESCNFFLLFTFFIGNMQETIRHANSTLRIGKRYYFTKQITLMPLPGLNKMIDLVIAGH